MAVIRLPPEPFGDGVVSLRPWRMTDARAVTSACQDPAIPRWTSVPSPYTEEHARGWLESLPEKVERDEAAPFALVLGESQEPAGSVGLDRIAWEHGRAEVGYWLAAPARGRGLMVRGVGLLAQWAFAEVGLRRLEIFADAENVASQRTAENAGFTREGVLRSYLTGSVGPFDAVSYSRLRDESPR